MTRLGWAILAAAVLGLAVYVLWPASGKQTWLRLWTGSAPPAFTLVADGREQRVGNDRVRIAGVDLPLDPAKARRLWDGLALLSALPADVSENVPDDALRHYGIDPTRRRIEAAGVRFSWGVAEDGRAYVADLVQHRVFAIDPARLAGLVARTGRLDRERLIDTGRAWRQATVDGLVLHVRGAEVVAAAGPQRPPFTLRARRLVAALEGVAVRDLVGVTPPAVAPAHALTIEYASAPGQPTPVVERVALRLWPGGDGGIVAVAGYPAQRVDAAAWKEWSQTLAAFAEDRLFNLDGGPVAQPIEAVVVERDGREWFSLRRRGLNDQDDGRSQWDVVWEGGREPADPLSPLLLLAAFNDLAVRAPRPRTADDAAPLPHAVTVRLDSKLLHGRAVLELAGATVRSPEHVAEVARLPALLAGLAPDRFLDLAVVGRSHLRAVRFQRQGRGADGQRLEQRFDRSERGAWAQVHPQPRAVDHLAVDRLVRALCQARAQQATLIAAADRARTAAVVDGADLTVALRFAAKPSAKADDKVALDETLEQDVGLAFARGDAPPGGDATAAPVWRAIETTGTRAWTVDAELVDLLRSGVDDAVLLPVAPALVGRIEVMPTRAGGGDPAAGYSLLRRGDGWVVLRKGQPAASARPAREREVRRWFRLLTTLRAEAVIAPGAPGAGRLAAERLAGTLFCELPGLEGDSERLTVEIGIPDGGRVAVHSESSRQAQAGIGGGEVAAAHAVDLLPPYERFVETAADGSATPAPQP